MLLASFSACSHPGECAPVTVECTPQYEPTFQNVFDNTLLPKCGVAGSQCHASEGGSGGVVFADADQAYDLLTGAGGQEARVDTQALGCGTLLSRVGAEDRNRVMPPGAPLDEAEMCAIVQWIERGANR